MKSYEMDLCSGSLWKKILFFSVPLMFSNILQVVFNLSDVAVVGKFAGPVALGAVGSTSVLITLFTGVLIGLAGGVNALTALFIGSKNKDSLRETVHTAAILCLGAGILLSVFGILFSRGILNILHTKAELIGDAVLYLRIYLLGMPALALYNFGNAVLSAAGDTRHPLYYLSLAGVLNVALNLFFVIGCHMGVEGVAIASILSQYLSAILILRLLLGAQEDFCLRPRYLRLTPDKAVRILQIGLPCALQNAIFAIANLFVQTGVNSFDHVVVEGNSAAANADPLVYDMMAAFYTACTGFIAQNFGANQKDRILKSYLICMLYSFAVGILLGVGLYLFRLPFLSLFTNERDVIAAGATRLSVMALSYGVSAFMDCTIAASRGLGKTILPMVMVILGSCVFRIVWVYTVFARFHTIESLYLLYVCSWALTAVAEILYFLHIYRQLQRRSGTVS
ncbi:MAG: MATE family efflux transporter [Clostridium sp.]|nr:MATE family efflux transporter [Acetatifactor muris]MCM1526210.1 MATE family efflux transporter [Bacteroides sp.]MCM1562642.1 MATE family efflux transporter [Clostridium sp.]